MADFTRLSNSDLENILNQYDIGDLIDFSSMKGGQANSSFILETTQGYFILSVCDEKNSEEINTLTMVLEYLESKGYPTSRIIQTRDKAGFITWSNKPVYMKRFMTGDVVKDLNSQMLFQAGQAMAKLHEIPPLEVMPDKFPYGFAAFEQVFDSGIHHSYLPWLKDKKKFLKAFFDSSNDTPMKKGFIHGDVFWDNLLFSGGDLIAVLDFEEACQYYQLFDIGMCSVGCCAQHGKFDINKISDLIQGYQSRIKLTTQEQKQLKIFIEYAAVAGSFWRFRQYNIKNPDEKNKNSYLELSGLADQIHEMSDEEFLNCIF